MNGEAASNPLTTPTLSSLSDFQARLLTLLHAGGSPEELLARAQAAAAETGLESYAAQFDPRMIAVASELVRKWGRRS